MLIKKLDSIEKILLNPQPVPNQESNDFLTVAETAAFLNLAVPTIYGLVHQGKIPSYKRSKRLYFSKAEIIFWVEDGRRKTAPEINNDALAHLSFLKDRRNNNVR